MISAGYYFARSFNAKERSGFFINPAILFGTMKEKFSQDLSSAFDVKATGFELTTGVSWFPIEEIGLKAVIGYRALRMKMNAFESTGEIINWSGPFLAAGICIALP